MTKRFLNTYLIVKDSLAFPNIPGKVIEETRTSIKIEFMVDNEPAYGIYTIEANEFVEA